MPAILIVTSKRDGHVAAVASHLDAAGASWVRLNTEDVAQNLILTISPSQASGTAKIRDSAREFRLEEVGAVWYRKPDPLNLSHFKLEVGSLDYVEAEFTEMLYGLYALMKGATWINHPLTARLSHRKLLQLHVASKVGFKTPRSVVTNEAEVALAFAESVGWDVAIKSLGALSVTEQQGEAMVQYGVFTRRVNKNELLGHKDKIAHMPTIFQEYVEKAYELRVTCVGDQTFCCRIDSQATEESREDLRFNARNLNHELIACPEIEPKIKAYMKEFGLNFGCFDIAVTPSGEFVFFECNPNGQWLWIEELTGAPIGKAIAELLLTACQPKLSNHVVS
jgi:glutathione synthase/RimK-type ligase-like ATP-grasp enzyme